MHKKIVTALACGALVGAFFFGTSIHATANTSAIHASTHAVVADSYSYSEHGESQGQAGIYTGTEEFSTSGDSEMSPASEQEYTHFVNQGSATIFSDSGSGN